MTEEPFVRLLVGAVACMVDELNERLAAAGYPGLRSTHGFVLSLLAEKPHTTVELAGALGMTKQGAGKVVAAMADLGLVGLVDHPDDARARLVRLTRRGRQARETAATVQRGMETEVARVTGRQDVDATRRVLAAALSRWASERPALRPLG